MCIGSMLLTLVQLTSNRLQAVVYLDTRVKLENLTRESLAEELGLGDAASGYNEMDPSKPEPAVV